MRRQLQYDLLAIIIVAVMFRVIYQVTYYPWWVGDSGGYTVPWFNFANHYWQALDGARTPLYPLFLGLIQGKPAAVVMTPTAARIATLIQSILGVVSACLIYGILNNIRCSRRLSLCGGLIFSVLAGICQFEMIILPHALASFTLIFALWLLTLMVRRIAEGRRWRLLAIFTGIAFSVSALVRPECVIFLAALAGTIFVLSFLFSLPPGLRPAILYTVASSAPLLLAWMTFNSFIIGRFTITSLTGMAAALSTYNMFDRVDPEDRVLGSIMRKPEYHDHGYVRDIVCRAWPELIAHSGEMPIKRRAYDLGPDLSAYIGEVSHKLMCKAPDVWLRNAWESFVWTFSFRYYQVLPEEKRVIDSFIRNAYGSKLAIWLDYHQAPLLTVFYIVTLAWTLAGVVFVWRERDGTVAIMDATTTAISVAILASGITYGLLAAYAIRYSLAYLGAIVFCGTYAIHRVTQWIETRWRKRKKGRYELSEKKSPLSGWHVGGKTADVLDDVCHRINANYVKPLLT